MVKRIRTTHVGSLPRKQQVVDLIFAREKEENYDQGEFAQTMTAHVSSTVAKQVESGIDIVSDGETSKISYATYVKDRYHGFGGDSERNAPENLKLFLDFLQNWRSKVAHPITRGLCVLPIFLLKEVMICRTIFRT